jgi:thiosulfate dehydrogenase [quinone] large subunit
MGRRTSFVITREQTWAITAASVALFVVLNWLFADGMFGMPLWNSEEWVSSPVITYIMIALIIAAGWYQASTLPAQGITMRLGGGELTPGQVEDPLIWRLLLGNVFVALFWLPIRFYVGREWLTAGLHKVTAPAWMDGGSALQGYWQGAVAVPEGGGGRITYDWFRQFIQYMLDNQWYTWFAKLVAIGEVLIGLGLIVGALVGIAAFFGTLMNFSFMLAGTTSSNPVLFGLAVFLVFAWKVAGYWGLDRYLLPALGTPWQKEGTAMAPEAVIPGGLSTGRR